jgi:fibronectin type 3 domain-containing protein
VTGLTNGTAYTFWVFAVNAAGSSGPSGGVISTPRTIPGAPQNATAAPAKAKGVLLTWTAPATNGGSAITNYRIYRRTASGSFQLIWTLGVRFDYTDTGTVRGTTYFYVIRAVNAAGEGPPSAEVSAIAK